MASRSVFDVRGVDIESRVHELERMDLRVKEPALKNLFESVDSKRNFAYGYDGSILQDCDLIFVCVGTPSKYDGAIDVTQLKSASKVIVKELENSFKRPVVVLKSTVTPSVCSDFRNSLCAGIGKQAGKGFGLVVNPEFFSEGRALEGLFHPDRIVVGVDEEEAAQRMRKFYSTFHGDDFENIPYIETSFENAALIKYASNLFLSLKVGAINEISRICEKTPNADIDTVATGVGLDRRLARSFLRAGPGWGGSCLGKDIKALRHYSEQIGVRHLDIADSSLSSNERQKEHVVELAQEFLGPLKGKRASILGVAFKEGTSDVRDSPALSIVSSLISKGVEVAIYDSPETTRNFRSHFSDKVLCCSTIEDCIEGSDISIFLGEDESFCHLQPSTFAKKLSHRLVVDTRRVLDPKKFRNQAGLTYVAIGVSGLATFEKSNNENLNTNRVITPKVAFPDSSR